jgi:hypothetical protein
MNLCAKYGCSAFAAEGQKYCCKEHAPFSSLMRAQPRPVRRHHNVKTVLFNGVTKTVTEWADTLGITHSTLAMRLRTHSVKEAMVPGRLTKPFVPKPSAPPFKFKTITHNGKSQHLAAWAEELGLDRGTLSWRLRHHPVEVALTPKRLPGRRR